METRQEKSEDHDADLERAREGAMREGRPAFFHHGTVFATDSNRLWVGLGKFKSQPGENAELEGVPRLRRLYGQVSELTAGERIGTRLVAEMACDQGGGREKLVALASDGVWNLDSGLAHADLIDFWAEGFQDLKGTLLNIGVPDDDVARCERDITEGRIEVQEDDPHRNRPDA